MKKLLMAPGGGTDLKNQGEKQVTKATMSVAPTLIELAEGVR